MSPDLPVPKAEAKPSTLVPEDVAERAFAAARRAIARRGSQLGDAIADAVNVAYEAGIAAGRAQAAAIIREHLGPDPSPASPAWWAGYSEALSDCARIATGGAEGDQFKDLE